MIKFQPSKSEKVVISIRIEDYKLEEIDKIASKIDISRNELINQCLDYAINNLEFKNIKKEKKNKK
ncbi:MAG: CopG family transcriptional regulator [Bacilli bacterium]|nr:CopG family transcriptional regulator [Bacilli bacterium]